MFDPSAYSEPTFTGLSKVLEPGTHFARIVNLELVDGKNSKQPDSLYVQVTLEGPDQGDDFQGFRIDKNNEALGNYRGQIATVKNGTWPYSDFDPKKDGNIVTRDTQIYNFVTTLAKRMGKLDALIASGQKSDTIEDYVELVAQYLIDADNWGLFTLAGDPYQSDKGHTNYRLFFPRMHNGCLPYAPAQHENEQPEKFITFNEDEHILKPREGRAAAPATSLSTAAVQPGQPYQAPQAPAAQFAAPAPRPAAAAPVAGGGYSDELDQLPF